MAAVKRKGRGRQKKALPPPTRPQGSKGRRPVAELDTILEYLARGWPPALTRDRLRQDYGIEISREALKDYRKTHAEEIGKRRETWLADLRGEPLANRRNRVRELARLYAAALLQAYREACQTCVGQGVVLEAAAQGGQAAPRRCESCRGRKWVVAPEVTAYVEALDGDVRLETLPQLPPAPTPGWTERLDGLLVQLRQEVGDHFSPRDKGQVSEEQPRGTLVFVGTDAARAVGEAFAQMLVAPPEKIVELYQQRAVGALREAGDGVQAQGPAAEGQGDDRPAKGARARRRS